MPFRETRRNTDAEKASEVGKQSKAEKKSETSEQRLWRYTRLFKSSLIGTMMLTAGMGGALADQSRSLQTLSGSDNATDLPPALDRKEFNTLSHWTALEFDPGRVTPEVVEHFKKLGVQDPEQLIRNVQQGTYDEEASSEQEEYSKHTGRDPLSSNREKIDTLRSLMDKLKEDPEALQIFKKTLNNKQVRARLLIEGDSEIPAARTLLTDEKSTCHDLCSDIPASVDCIKQCTITVASNTSACLNVSLSDVLAKLEPVPGLQEPNQEVRLNYTLSVQNHCPQTIKDVTYQVQGAGDCMKTLQFFSADPSLVAPRDSAGVKAGQDPSMTTSCWGSLPSFLSSYISASGTDTTTDLAVSSPYKTFIVLGNRPYVMSECHQTCPPATDTTNTPPATDTPSPHTMNAPKTPSETDTPSIVFVHGIKIGPEIGPTYRPTKGDDSGWDCNKYWGAAMTFLGDRGLGDLRDVKYYNRDENCQNANNKGRYSSDLHHDLYKSKCIDYHAGKEGTKWEGTNDESLYHLSCLFAQYLHHNFGQSNSDVILVAHSMGGIIVRETLYQMEQHAGQHPFPSTIGRVTKAITFNSPHGGVFDINAIGCGGCQQAKDLVYKSDFMLELSTTIGKNPQPDLLTKGLTTEWTVIGSECDNVVGGPLNPNRYANAINMNADYAVVYAKDKRDKSTTTCYDHGGALKDSNAAIDAQRYYCDTSDPGNYPCGIVYTDTADTTGGKWRHTENGLRGLSQMYYSVTGRLPEIPNGARMAGKLPSGAERVGSSHHLWLLSTAATAWALLRR